MLSTLLFLIILHKPVKTEITTNAGYTVIQEPFQTPTYYTCPIHGSVVEYENVTISTNSYKFTLTGHYCYRCVDNALRNLPSITKVN